ncbi:hypothetical protein Drose_37310 [Dactylosporangium roseum]|uniref:Uncharacterized protein n=1 Tax=Dactylosporangium roseum TaxID=47989 RepID=A0ABY5Z4W1_9ACTN|nr:hypothetical protein [Dactylosporangium roseum]UWZ36601.1 hypothetical protein Drose_37310 [Dactylosporangium roseum]
MTDVVRLESHHRLRRGQFHGGYGSLFADEPTGALDLRGALRVSRGSTP